LTAQNGQITVSKDKTTVVGGHRIQGPRQNEHTYLITVHVGTRAVGTLAWTAEQALDHLVDVFVWHTVPRTSTAAMHTPDDAAPPPMPVRTTASRSSGRDRRCC